MAGLVERSIKGIIFNFLGQIGSSMIAIVTSVLIIRLLTPLEYGIYAILFAIAGLASPFISLGMSSALNRFLPELRVKKEREKERRMFRQVALIQVGLAGVVTVILLLFAENIAIFLNIPTAIGLIRVYSLSLVPATIVGALDTVLIANFKQKFLNSANIFVSALTLSGLSVILILRLGLAEIVILGVVMTYAACLVKGSYALIRREYVQERLTTFTERILGYRFWRYSLSMFVIALGDFILSYVSALYFLTIFRSIEEVGYFRFAYGVAYTFIHFVPAMIVGLIVAAAAEAYTSGGTKALNQVFRQNVKFTMIAAIPTGIVGIIVAQDIISVIYDPKYLPALLAFQLSFFLIASNKWQGAIGMVAVTMEKTEILIYGKIISVVKILLYLLLIPPYGIIGAIIATQVSWYIVLFFEYSMLRKHIHLDFPAGVLGKYLLAGSITGLAVYSLKYVVAITTIPLLLLFFAIAGGVFFVGIRYLNALEEIDYKMLIESNIPYTNLILRILGYKATNE